MTSIIPKLSDKDVEEYLNIAKASLKRRYPLLLHSNGDTFNRVFNFMLQDSYMQPHLHPGEEKIEIIHIVHGRATVVFFNEHGVITDSTVLENGGVESVEVPAFKWHTYIMNTEYVVTYETMMGVYDPKTWKIFAEWAPKESECQASQYLSNLRGQI